MTPLTLDKIEAALRASWAADTCSPGDLARAGWHAGNPAWGHCDITALVLHDLLGGELMLGEVRRGAERHGYHWWNRLASGVEIDLTRSQFVDGQEVVAARPVARPTGSADAPRGGIPAAPRAGRRPPRPTPYIGVLRGMPAGSSGPSTTTTARNGSPWPRAARRGGGPWPRPFS